MRLGKKFFYFVIFIFSMGLIGCSEHRQNIKFNGVLVNRLPVDYKIKTGKQTRRYINHFLEAGIEGENYGMQKYDDIIYRFRWYDSRKREIAEQFSIWEPLFLEPGEKRRVTALAPVHNAKSFRFYIKTQEESQVRSIDPNSFVNTDVTYSAEDLHQITAHMVSSILQNKLFDKTIVIGIGKIENRTDEHIDTAAIADIIQTAIIKSGRAQFVDISMRDKIASELAYQHKNSRQIVPDYLLSGRITSIRQRNNKIIDDYYQITLQLHNIERGTVDWSETKKVRKNKSVLK